jgi:hypothetical protein
MRQTDHIAEQFLAVYGEHPEARQRAERFLEGLAQSQLWEQDELDELRRLIVAGLEGRESI